jgi:hypothetical protein
MANAVPRNFEVDNLPTLQIFRVTFSLQILAQGESAESSVTPTWRSTMAQGWRPPVDLSGLIAKALRIAVKGVLS